MIRVKHSLPKCNLSFVLIFMDQVSGFVLALVLEKERLFLRYYTLNRSELFGFICGYGYLYKLLAIHLSQEFYFL